MPRDAALFFFLIFFNLISWRHKFKIKYNRKLLFVFHAEVSDFSDQVYFGMRGDWRCSFLIQIVHIHYYTCSYRLEMFWIYCQNSAIKMTNGIRKFRRGVDILDKRSLDFCKIHLGQKLVTSWCSHIEIDSIKRINVFPIGIRLLYI